MLIDGRCLQIFNLLRLFTQFWLSNKFTETLYLLIRFRWFFGSSHLVLQLVVIRFPVLFVSL